MLIQDSSLTTAHNSVQASTLLPLSAASPPFAAVPDITPKLAQVAVLRVGKGLMWAPPPNAAACWKAGLFENSRYSANRVCSASAKPAAEPAPPAAQATDGCIYSQFFTVPVELNELNQRR